MRTLATLVFIGATALVALLLFQRPTIADGKVMASDLLGKLAERGITQMTCDDQIPIGKAGAVFHCTVGASDGSTAKIQYTMDREGKLDGRIVTQTGPTRATVPATSDPWGN